MAEGKEAFFSACSKMNENILIDRNRGALVVNGLSILNLSRISGDLSFSSSPNDFRYSRYSSIAFVRFWSAERIVSIFPRTVVNPY